VLGTRITDGAGEIPFFTGQFADFAFWITEGTLRKRVLAGGEYMVGNKRNLQQSAAAGDLYTVTPHVDAATLTEVVLADPGAQLSGSAARLTATATPALGATVARVQFLVKGAPLTTPVTGAYETTLDTTTLKNGSYPATAQAFDTHNVTTSSASVTINVNNPPPTVTITAPPAGDIVGTVVWTADAAPGAGMTLKQVQFQIDGKNFGLPVLSSPFSTNLDPLQLKNGEIKLTAIAEDTVGNTTTSDTVTVKVTNPLPAVQITSPAATTAVTGVFAITADARAMGSIPLSTVQFKIAGKDYEKPIKADPSQSTYAVNANAAELNNGNVVITAVATDTAGNSKTSDAVTVTANNPPPTITVQALPHAGAYASFLATSSPGAGMTLQGVQFKVDGSDVGRLLRAGPFVLADYQFSPGDHVVVATAHDTAGNSASAEVTVTTV
jgi:hypothetical protein